MPLIALASCELLLRQEPSTRAARPPHSVFVSRPVEVGLSAFRGRPKMFFELLSSDASLEDAMKLLRVDVSGRLFSLSGFCRRDMRLRVGRDRRRNLVGGTHNRARKESLRSGQKTWLGRLVCFFLDRTICPPMAQDWVYGRGIVILGYTLPWGILLISRHIAFPSRWLKVLVLLRFLVPSAR
jgi:hypothetical protein